MSRFYVTTPIYYVNAVPHLGTFYTTVVADALARYQRARHGKSDVFFLTGLDEHGQKIERMARDKGLDPQAYCDDIAAKFQATWARAGISNDDFIRTTQERHKTAVAEMWQRMKHDIFEDEYDGMYCVGCEEAKSEDDVYVEGDQKLCLIHRKPIERVKERNYFFDLPKYRDHLLSWYAQTPSPVQPESRRNEVRAFVERGLRPLSISRSTVKWGLPVPGDPTQVIYVWIDALTNYLTVLGGPGAVERGEGLGAFWAGANHLIAKDILRFHAIYWPAMLKSAGLPMPKRVFCHGYLTVKGEKIAKSMPATRIDPNVIADELGVDPLRYFLLREYAFGGDGDFTYEALFQRYESDLGNDLGNLLNRTVSMAHRYFEGTVPAASTSGDIATLARQCRVNAEESWEAFSPQRALESTWKIARDFNGYIDLAKPWVLAREPESRGELAQVLANCCEALRWSALLVAPAMPGASREILRQLGRGADEGTWPDDWRWPGGSLAEPKPIFPRIEPDRQADLIGRWTPAADPAAPTGPTTNTASGRAVAPATREIALDDFARLDLRVARVVAAEAVPKADKLLKLTLDVGGEPRTVVSGIAPAYGPAEMVGRTVIYLANLKPAKIRGVVSQGMILAAGDAEVLALSTLDRDVPPGTRVR
jgi:methionyl-tRNA synthetase